MHIQELLLKYMCLSLGYRIQYITEQVPFSAPNLHRI